MATLNLGILAHVDAGKTSLTERLLHSAGVTGTLGSVDDGSTRTDSLALERQRGITIKSAVVSFELGGRTINLLDTPGHPDFIAEVERVLAVLDGAVLVISAVEGVQAQTRVLMRTLRRLRIPTLIFVNKTDRRGARYHGVLGEIADKLTPAAIAMEHPSRDSLVELLAENNEEVLARYLANEEIDLHGELAAQTARALTHPVYSGSAITGDGIPRLIEGITGFLPAVSTSDSGDAFSGTVFKVDRTPAGEKVAYVRMFTGAVRVRDRLESGKITGIEVFEHGSTVPRAEVRAGQIGLLRGLAAVRIGDTIGEARTAVARQFPPPTLETVVVAGDQGKLHSALTQLAEQDPLINLRQDGNRGEISLSLYGEVQKEVIQATLADEFGVAVEFRETTTIHIERLTGTGEAVELIGTDSNPFLATVGLRVEPVPPGTGIEFALAVELGSMPPAFFKAVEETLPRALRHGVHGWAVPDCRVIMTHSGYYARQSHSHGTFDKSMSSTAGDFRELTIVVLRRALARAGTRVHEPIHRFRFEFPADLLGQLSPVLSRLRAVPVETTLHGGQCVIEGEIPAARVHELRLRLPSLTRGEGVLESEFDHHRPA